MYVNIFDMCQGAKAQLLLAAVMFPTTTTKQQQLLGHY
jgi:hypothetical protein